MQKLSRIFQSQELFVLFIICLIGLLLRLWGLSIKEFWYDEAYTGILTNLPAKEYLELVKYDVHPPIYINLLRNWVFLFGSSDFTIRIFSVLAGVLLIPASYLLVKCLKIAKKHSFLKFVIPLIFAVNPFFVEYSKEARSYSLTALFFSGLFLSYFLASKYKSFNLRWLLTAVMAAVSFLTHYFSILGIICLLLFDLLFSRENKISFKKYLFQKFRIYLFLALSFFILIASQLTNLFTQYQNAPLLWWIPVFEPTRLITSFYIFLLGAKTNILGVPPVLQLPSVSPETVGFIFFSVFVCGLFYLLAKLKGLEKRDLILLSFTSIVPLLLTLLLQLYKPHIYLERYLTPYAVFIILTIFIIIFKFKRIFTYLTVSTYIVISLFLVTTIDYQPQGFAELARQLDKVETKNTQVIFSDPISFTIAKYYLAKNPNLAVKIYDPKRNFDDWEIISKSEVLKNFSQLKDKQRLFIFTDSHKPDIWFRQKVKIGKLFVYSTLRIFDQDLAEK